MLPVIQSEDLKVSTVHLHQAIVKIRIENGEPGIRSNDFIARVADELEGDHYETFVVKNPNKTESTHFMITMDQAKLVAMRESKTVRKIVLDRLKEYENNNKPKFSIPQSFAEALRLAADQQEVIQSQAAQIEHQKPAVEFVERYVESTGNLGFRQVCKLLKAKENDFRAFLEDKRIMYRLGGAWVAYASHIDAGRFYVTTGTGDNDHNYTSAKFTPKGVEWVAKLWSAK
jgi:phage antirepressor YoqD-like protein